MIYFFVTAVNELFVSIAALQPMVAKMDLLAMQCNYKVSQFGRFSYQDLFWLFLKGTLYSQLPGSHYRQPIKAFYSRAFHVHHGNSYYFLTTSYVQLLRQAVQRINTLPLNKKKITF